MGQGERGEKAELSLRRVVTGHDQRGKAVVASDTILTASAPRPGQEALAIWGAAPIPCDNLLPAGAEAMSGSRLPEGAVFRVVSYLPGSSGNMHRTQTLDFGIVLDGGIILELDDGVEVALGAGDALVQRGTIHRWINRGDKSCTIAFVLVDAMPIDSEPG